MRVIQGLSAGVSMPAMNVLIAQWSPELERSYLSSIVFSGTSIGPILSIVTAGILAKYFGWEAIFYVHGSLACIWLILWAIFISNTPSDNYFISESEMIYITSNCSYNKNLNNSMVLV